MDQSHNNSKLSSVPHQLGFSNDKSEQITTMSAATINDETIRYDVIDETKNKVLVAPSQQKKRKFW